MPLARVTIQKEFGRFRWREAAKPRGGIIIAGDWILDHLTRIDPPLPLVEGRGRPLKTIACHALIADHLLAALRDIKSTSDALIHTFDGCFVARHTNWDPKKPLSHHSWGIAVDINAAQFPYGSHKRQDRALIRIFANRGFEWGGTWRIPDPMHFEYSALEYLHQEPHR